MYCPKCGQAQVSDDVRFCSRCGQSLSGLIEWLSAGQAPGQTAIHETMSPRRKAVRRGAKVTFLSVVLFVFTFVVALAENEPALLFIPLTLMLIGVAWMLYARLFMDGGVRLAANHELSGAKQSAQKIDHGTVRPAIEEGRLSTGEMIRPPSVTEHTTNLLR